MYRPQIFRAPPNTLLWRQAWNAHDDKWHVLSDDAFHGSDIVNDVTNSRV